MRVRQTPGAGHRRCRGCCLAVLITAGTLAVAGCAHPAPKAAAAIHCGTSHTAANVPVEVNIDKGRVSCTVALTVESDYAKAIVAGKAPGNGGGGPVKVNGWTCQGFPTPELLKTGETSKCVKDGTEILATLKTSG